jgi:hypothetical protein
MASLSLKRKSSDIFSRLTSEKNVKSPTLYFLGLVDTPTPSGDEILVLSGDLKYHKDFDLQQYSRLLYPQQAYTVCLTCSDRRREGHGKQQLSAMHWSALCSRYRKSTMVTYCSTKLIHSCLLQLLCLLRASTKGDGFFLSTGVTLGKTCSTRPTYQLRSTLGNGDTTKSHKRTVEKLFKHLRHRVGRVTNVPNISQ